MKTRAWIGAGIVATVIVVLVVVVLAAGWALWGRHLWADGRPAYALRETGTAGDGFRSGWRFRRGGGMMGPGPTAPRANGPWHAEGSGDRSRDLAGEFTLEEARRAVEAYLQARGLSNLEVAEVMAFEHNFYAIAREPDAGFGAMELLVDRETGAVGPEIGPNMMWNARYGMHRRGPTGRSGRQVNTVAPEEAVAIAQRWLDRNRPGVFADDHADPFYGYYTIHTIQDGRVEGMLSVHGTTGQVWYHTWHGRFLEMIEHENVH